MKHSSKDDYVIRPARPDDAEAIVAIWQPAAGDHARYDADRWAWADNAPEKYRLWILDCLTKEDSIVLVAADSEDHVSAFAVVQVRDLQPFLAYSRWAQVIWLVASEKHRRKGLGGRLLQAAGEFARSRGAHRLSLMVAHDNASARQFYEAMGMKSLLREMYMPL